MSVSILMPVKNAQAWLEETISSILNQTYTDWELICVNDHSSDESESIITHFATNDNRIILVQNKGEGIIPALQLGLSLAKGDFITRFDADDQMPPHRLEWMSNALNPAGRKSIVTGKVEYFGQQNVSEGYLKYQNWLNDRIQLNDHFDHIYRECVIASPNWMARRNELIENCIFDQLEYPEDYDMTFHWMTKGFAIVPLQETTLHWREHPTRTSRNSNVYDQASFFRLKMSWFVKRTDKQKRIGILGAGIKGKRILELIQDKFESIQIYDLKHVNYTNPIGSTVVQDPLLINDELILIAVFPENQEELISFIESKNYTLGKNAWFV